MTGAAFASLLRRHGFDFFSGVPCSLIEDLIGRLERDRAYIPAVREDVAIGIAGGAWFGGRRPAVLMQNSGLGTSLNALASFSLMYGLPALLLVTWRGYEGKDAPEHILMGRISEALLELLGIPQRVLSADPDGDVAWAAREMDATMRPVALLIPPKSFDGGAHMAGLAAGEHARIGPLAEAAAPPPPGDRLAAHLSRFAAMAVALKQLGAEPLVAANGYISREAFAIADRPQNFYMIGSMGLAAAIALGIAESDERAAVVFDGDGNLLMSLGVLAMIGARRPRRFIHCVFDNEVYGSTGNQRSLSREVRLDRLAAAAGYRSVVATDDEDGVAAAVRAALRGDGPHFVLVKVTAEQADVPRIPYTPAAMRDRFRAGLTAA